MKTRTQQALMAAFTALLAAGSAHAQKGSQPPAPVGTTFTSTFPNAQKVKWEKEKDGNFEAEFTLSGQEQSATFLADGTLKETESGIAKSQVPAAVLAAFGKDYPGVKAREFERIVRADKSVIYEIEVKMGGKEQDLLYDELGQKTQ